MGVVRREGDWRLEKHAEGVYEITFQRNPQMKIVTSDAPSRKREGDVLETVPVRRVSTFKEAGGLFEEKAHGPPPFGAGHSSTSDATNSAVTEPIGLDTDIEFGEVPPYGIGVGFIAAGAFIIYAFRETRNSLVPLFGIGFMLIGLLPFIYAGYRFREEGWHSAWDFIVTVESDCNDTRSLSKDTEKTPPGPDKLKNRLIFDRAAQQCEWCEEKHDHLQVHHSEPRRDGGPNEPENLIVLCPNCHEHADRGARTHSKSKAKVERLPDVATQ